MPLATNKGSNASPLLERLERVERQFATGNGSYEAPNGIIMFRVSCIDLAAVLKLARAQSEKQSDG